MRDPAARIGYVSFDTVPAPKGAATHIGAFAKALAAAFGPIDLVTVGAGTAIGGPVERWPGVVHTELPALGATLIDRVLCFRRFLVHWLDGRCFEAVQFRSIFEGVPLLALSPRTRLIFEVNGLASIELKYRYQGVEDDRELMRKLIAQEQACLDVAARVITPSGVTGSFLAQQRGISSGRIASIPNGVDTDLFRPAGSRRVAPEFTMLYFGTLSSWQGVELAVRALAQVRARIPAALKIIGLGSGDERDTLAGLAAKLGVAAHVAILPPVTQPKLAEHARNSDAVLAPLAPNDRNLVQGCCPLKVLEGMAAGVPVIASDMPVVRELGCDGEHFLLVKPGSVDQLAEAVLRLAANRDLAARIGANARAHVLANFTWRRAGDALVRAYEELGISRARIA